MNPSIEQIKGNCPTVNVVFINTAVNTQSTQTNGVTGTPTTIVFRDGTEVNRYTGEFDIASLEQQLDALTNG
jgi:protein-disulfide isomerase